MDAQKTSGPHLRPGVVAVEVRQNIGLLQYKPLLHACFAFPALPVGLPLNKDDRGISRSIPAKPDSDRIGSLVQATMIQLAVHIVEID